MRTIFTSLELVDLAALAKQLSDGNSADTYHDQLRSLHKAACSGVITEDEFDQQALTLAQAWVGEAIELTAGMTAHAIQARLSCESIQMERPVSLTRS